MANKIKTNFFGFEEVLMKQGENRKGNYRNATLSVVVESKNQRKCVSLLVMAKDKPSKKYELKPASVIVKQTPNDNRRADIVITQLPQALTLSLTCGRMQELQLKNLIKELVRRIPRFQSATLPKPQRASTPGRYKPTNRISSPRMSLPVQNRLQTSPATTDIVRKRLTERTDLPPTEYAERNRWDNNEWSFTVNKTRSPVVRRSSRSGEGGGMRNMGNTCYISAVLQALLGLDRFKDDLVKNATLDVNKENVVGGANMAHKRCRLHHALHSVITAKSRIEEGTSLKGGMMDPTEVQNCVKEGMFKGNTQQDAHEFLLGCIEQLEMEGGKAMVAPNFECEIEHTITCNACKEQTHNRQVYNNFSLILPEKRNDSVSIKSLLKDFFKEEQVECACEKCGAKSAALSHKFVTLPRYLIVHIKRFEMSYDTPVSKRTDAVLINKTLNVEPYASADVLSSVDVPNQTSSVPSPLTKLSDIDAVYALGAAHVTRENKEAVRGPRDSRLLVKSELSMALPTPCTVETTPPSYKRPALSSKESFEADQEEELRRKRVKTRLAFVKPSPATRQSREDSDWQLAEALRRSCDDVGGSKEDQEIQKAIELSMASHEAEAVPEGTSVDDGSVVADLATVDEDELENVDENPNTAYTLNAIVSHVGKSASNGHYVADVKQKGDMWKHYNDSIVTERTQAKTFQNVRTHSGGYIMFYETVTVG